jgi:hypothetical protein
MVWRPIGPDHVFTPRNPAFKRVSRRNEVGRQGLPGSVTVDPTDRNTVYVCERPSSGGTTAFRTRNGGDFWTPIADSLQQVNKNVDPIYIAVNPGDPSGIYLGTHGDGAVYVSTDRGDSWGPRRPVGSNVRKLIVDPRTVSDPDTTVLYAATTNGVYRSPDNGNTWVQVLAGDVRSLVAHFSPAGTAVLYAGVYAQGVFRSTDPVTGWQNLNAAGIGLPAHTAGTPEEPEGNFNAILVDLCPRNSDRVYAWMVKWQCDAQGSCSIVTAALYTTSTPTTAWTQVTMVSPPQPAYNFYCFNFAVSPSSPGDGTNDVLFFASVNLHRSTDGGVTWSGDANWFHADQQTFAFCPTDPPPGTVADLYLGCDGGVAVSTGACDPAFPFSTAATYFGEGPTATANGLHQNRNRGKQSSAVYQYTSHPALPALGYIGCQDTGVAAGTGSLGWRGIADADAGACAVAPASDGVKLWGILGAFMDWPSFRMRLWTDQRQISPGAVEPKLSPGGSLIAPTSNLIADLAGNCLTGARTRDPLTTLAAAIGSTGSQVATPASMSGINVGVMLEIDSETVIVTAVAATTFTATFAQTHAAGSPVAIYRAGVLRVDGAGTAARISQVFGTPSPSVNVVAASATNPNLLACASDDRVYLTSTGASAGPDTVWVEGATARPVDANVNAIAIDVAGEVHVLLRSPVDVGLPLSLVTTPLFTITGGVWVPQVCVGLPGGTPALGFTQLVADPVAAGTLYAAHDDRVYRLVRTTGVVWTWTDISAGLPGQWIYDLWIGNVGTSASPTNLLRAAVPTRGVFEEDVSPGATTPAVALYVRDNLLDIGRLSQSPDGVPNPYSPAQRVWHYQCEDVKVDTRQPGLTPGSTFFQTDPEAGVPVSHVIFDQLRDNSQALPALEPAKVHVQVHNRGSVPATGVRVWAIYCNAAAGVPSLAASPSQGNAYPFWSQFTAMGDIVPGLPADSPWRAVGSPVTLGPVTAADPQVATWNWTVPALASGASSGHYCIAVFVHSAASPINETSLNVDEITPRNRQVGQKNLQIGAPLPPGPAPGGGGAGGSGVPGEGQFRELIEFHNPLPSVRIATLVFDLRLLPPALTVTIRLGELTTLDPLYESVGGASRLTEEPLTLADRLRQHQPTVAMGKALEWLGWRVSVLGRRILGLPERDSPPEHRRPVVPLRPAYMAKPGGVVSVRGVVLGPYGKVVAEVHIVNDGELSPGAEYRFDVQQVVKGEVAGGVTYVVPTAGDPDIPKQPIVDSHRIDLPPEELERIEREADDMMVVPPFARRLSAARRREQGRDVDPPKIEADRQDKGRRRTRRRPSE